MTAPLPLYKLLVVDDDSAIRDNLKEYLLFYHQAPYRLDVEEASTAEDALDKLSQNQYDLLICDINLPDKDGFHILEEARIKQPNIKEALITAYDIENYIELAQQTDVHNIIIKTAPFNFEEFSNVVDNLLDPASSFGLSKYLGEDTALTKVPVSSSGQIMEVQVELRKFFEHFALPDVDALCIAMVEAITNAVYHSAKNPDGSFRYQKGEVIEQLAPHEQVWVCYGHDDEKLGVSIRDQGGTLTAQDILYWLERNISGKSLMDTHGRGIFLIYRLMDRMLINIQKQEATELVMLHYLNTDSMMENKPIYINEMA